MKFRLFLLAALCSGCAGANTPEEGAPLPAGPREERSERASPRDVDWASPLSLETCLRLAEQNAGTARGFRARVERARAEITAAEAFPNPTASLLLQDAIRAGHVEQALVGFQPFTLWQRGPALRAARAGLTEARAQVAADRRALHFEVGRAFYGLIAAEKLANLEAASASITSGLTAQVSGRVFAGDASPLDLDRARADDIDARAARSAALLRVERERYALALALGVPGAGPLTVEERWPEPLSRALVARAELQARSPTTTGEAHPRIAHALARVASARATLELEDRRRFGLDQAVLNLGVRRQRSEYGAVVALQAPLPVFDRNRGARARARAELSAAEAALAQARDAIRIQLRSATASWEGALLAREDLRDLVARREAIVSRTADLLETRHATVQEVLLAQRDAVSARRRLIATELDAALTRWRLLLLTEGAEPVR